MGYRIPLPPSLLMVFLILVRGKSVRIRFFMLLIPIKMNLTSPWIGLLVVVVVVILILTLSLIVFKHSCSKLVDPSKAASTRGAYGVIQSVSPTTAVIGCDPSGTGNSNNLQFCAFNGVTSLSDAIKLCDIHVKVCDGFIYSPNTQTVNFVDTRHAFRSNTMTNTGWDAYIRQYPRSYV
jgi:hypothetical protein